MTNNWEQILRDHGRSVWRTACRIVRDPADADDCMQEAFLDAVELSRRQVVRDWGPLLRRIATSRALDRLRKTIRRGAREDAGEDVGAIACDDPASDPERLASGRELHEKLRLAVARLSPQQAEAFCLRYLEDMEYCEISEALRIDVNQVGVVLHRARSRLRELLATVARDHGEVRCRHD